MKKILLIALLSLVPSLSFAQCSNTSFGGTYTAVQCGQHTAASFADATVAQFPGNVTAGNAIGIAFNGCGNSSCSGTPTALTFSDTLNGAWTCPASAAFVSNSFVTGFCFVCNATTGATTVSKIGGTAFFMGTAVFEIHTTVGPCIPLTLDAFGGAFPTSTTTPNVTTSSPTVHTNEPVLSFVTATTSNVTWTGNGGGYTMLESTSAAALQAKNGATLSTYSSSWSATVSQNFIVMIITLGSFASSAPSGYPMVIKYRPFPSKKVPWDNRRRKLEIVRT